ncbi:MAG TPA: hypothetical protein VHM66_03095, partial [Solirubrobacterales bacterium]|nr:hypothetical protein [Solirubrobacterales bacterium]
MKQHARSIAARSKWPFLAMFAIAACALVFAACGGSSSSSSSSEETTSSGGETAKGEPIVTWTYTDVNTEGPQY